MNNTLITKDSKGKIRIVEISCEWEDDYSGYVIRRITSQYKGKRTEQPIIIISKGKAKRTVSQQAELEYKSHIKKYTDKGYKVLDQDINNLTEEELKSLLPEDTTDANGNVKPMLAKQYQDVATSAFNKNYYGSRKINGVRCLLCWDGNNITTRSRGASIDYNLAINHIVTHPKLIEWFKQNPTITLDGEIYKFGWTLNHISGLCRTQSTVDDGIDLEFYVYDYIDKIKPFKERLEFLEQFAENLNLSFNPERIWEKDELKIQIVPHEFVTGWVNIKTLHDKYVSEGWEGLVIRNEDKPYMPGSRGNQMIKVKEYFEAEYPITGISEGLRDEDMCFTLTTPKGYEFKAKPIGDRYLKQRYLNEIDSLIGKMATVKYFEMSGAGTDRPQQPTLISIRDYE